MAIVKHSDIFDDEGFKRAMQESKNAVGELGKSVDEVFSRLNSQQKELNTVFKQYSDILKGFNVSSIGAADALKKFNTEVDETIKRKRDNTDSEKGYQAALDVTKATLKEVQGEYTRLKKSFSDLKPDQVDYAQQVGVIRDRLKEVVPRLGEFTTAVKKTRADVDAAEGSYRKMSNELGELRNKLRTMAGAFDPVTGAINKNNKEALDLIARINQLDTTVKAADASMGIHARNVGNYASGYNGLRTQINQLTREVPSTINNLNSMFLAFSNNLPMLGDEISKLRQKNIELAASGEKPVSIFRQLTSALFSWQTLITVGITLLTLYGAKLVDWVGSLFSANDALDKVKKRQEELTAVGAEADKNSIKEITNLRILEKVATDVQKPMALRLRAVNDLQEKYPAYLGNLSQEAILNGEAAKQINLVAEALFKKSFYEAAGAKAAENAGKVIDLRKSETKYIKEQTAEQERLNKARASYKGDDNIYAVNTDAVKSEAQLIKIGGQLARNRKEQEEINKDISFYTTEAANAYEQFKKLDAKEFKSNQKSGLEDAAKREKAFLDSIRRQQALIQKAAELDIKQEELKYVRGEQQEVAYQLKKLNIIKASIEKQIALENRLGGKKDEAKIEGFKAKEVEAEENFTKFIQRQQDERRKLAAQSTNDVVKYNEDKRKKEEQAEDEQSKKFAEVLKRRFDLETEAENRRYSLLKAGKNLSFVEELEHLENIKRIRKKNAEDTAEIELQIAQKKADREKQIREETQAFIFNVATTGLQILQEQSRGESESRINALQNEKDRELALAGNNGLAREKIEKDYQKRVAREKTKQAKTDKEFALFNVAVNTAAAVAKTVAEWGMPFAIPFIALAVGQGLLQAAAIAARPIPKFAIGTGNAPKGPAIVNEVGFELMERKGKMYVAKSQGPTLVNLEGGEKIWTHEQSKKIIQQAHGAQEAETIIRSINTTGTMGRQMQEGRKNEAIAVMAQAFKSGGINQSALHAAFKDAVKEIPLHQTIMDERGMRKRDIEVNKRTTYLNNRLSN